MMQEQSASIIDSLIYATITLFLLSIITEKIATFIKKYPTQSQVIVLIITVIGIIICCKSISTLGVWILLLVVPLIWIGSMPLIFLLKINRRSHWFVFWVNQSHPFKHISKSDNSIDKKEAMKEMSTLSILIGFLVAAGFDASLIELFSSEPQFLSPNGFLSKLFAEFKIPSSYAFDTAFAAKFFGYVFTGFFLSFGSKFFHDLLDRLYEIKRVKRALADKNTFTLDNADAVAKIVETYESEFIQSAYAAAKEEYKPYDELQAISLGRDDDGYYINIVLSTSVAQIPDKFTHYLPDGRIYSVPINKDIMGQELIEAQNNPHLGDKIFETNQPESYGTLGCLVKKTGASDDSIYLVTCYHNLVHPIKRVDEVDFSKLEPSNPSLEELGEVVESVWNSTMDACLIKLKEDVKNRIRNEVPGALNDGIPKAVRRVKSSDKGKTQVYFNGATSNAESATIAEVYADITVNYNGTKHDLESLMVLKYKGGAVSEGGDSGSVVLDENSNIVGMVVAGWSKATYAIPMDRIFRRFKVEVI